MDLLGLVMFSISVALFGGFQKIPFTDIQPENSFPRRLYGGFTSGYVLGKLGEILDIVLPVEQPATVLTSIDRSLPTNLTVCSSSAPTHPCPISTGTLASTPMWADHTPEPTVARTFIESQASIEMSDFPQVDGIGWFSRLLEAPRTFLLGGSDSFIHAGTVLLVLGTACIYFLFAYAPCKGVVFNLAGRVRVAHDEIDKAVAESELQRSLLLSKIELLKASVETLALFQATNETLQQRAATVASSFYQCSEEVLEECALLKTVVYDIKSECTTWPTRDELLHDYIKNFKDSLTAAKDDLDSEIDRLKNLIPNFTAEFHRTVKRLDGNMLGSLPMVYLRERQLLESNIQSIRDAMNKVPYLSSLQNEAALARAEMEDIQTRMRNMVANSREALRDTASMHKEIYELKDKLAYLEEELALSGLAIKSANTKAFYPEPSRVELPGDLVNDLVEETSSTNDQEDVSCDNLKELQAPEKDEESNPAPLSSASARSFTSDDVPESLQWGPVVNGLAGSGRKGGWNFDDDASSTMSLSPQYPPDKERNIFWASSSESDSEKGEAWKGGKAKNPRTRGPRNGARHRLAVTESARARRARSNKKKRAKHRATWTPYIVPTPQKTPTPAIR
ncbi:hypothetical protein EMCG_03735 [[Emmonsia] crescens]|uniref:Uncharacterized protein n=1 Tax=[Emmonsia] crescens TaxID=73230 RepID=A0A0G2J868_9EURO|nr:hypothetical protein EMCG_03735 [Emmonsia crescens UAMH 3008]